MIMGFGKRGAGDAPPARPSVQPQQLSESDGVLSVRTRVANDGGLDRGFIGLAVGVVVLSAGGAIAAPSVFNMFGGGVRPISEIVTGLTQDQIKVALATEAFPDEGGRAFMASLEQHFPRSYQQLLGNLTNAASSGADRDGLALTVSAWSMDFGRDNLQYFGRTGVEGFDEMLDIASDGLAVMNKELGSCKLDALQKLAEDPMSFASITGYGSDAYKTSMRANAAFVELAARGRKEHASVAKLNADDSNALQSVFFSILTDPQMMSIIQNAMSTSGGTPEEMQQALAQNIDFCQIGRTVIAKLDRLPSGTKSRLLAAAFSGDLLQGGPMMGIGGTGGMGGLEMSAPLFGPQQGMPPEIMKRLQELQ
jgi:hypothetical protein